MRFLDNLLRPKPPPAPAKPKSKGGHPTREQMAEKRKQRILEMETQLKVKELEQKLKAMDDGTQPRGLDTDTVLAVVRYLKSLGLDVVPHKGGHALEEEGMVAMLRGLAPMIGTKIGEVVLGGLSPSNRQALEGQFQISGPSAGVPQPQPQEAPEVGLIGLYLHSNLGAKPPAERALWLASQADPNLQALLAQLCQLPDGQLMAALHQVAQANPQYAPVANWVLGQGELWIVETVRELRRLRSAPGAGQSSP